MPPRIATRVIIRMCVPLCGIALLAGCCWGPDPELDGRLWREPGLGKSKPAPTAISVGRYGLPRRSGIGPGTVLSDEWPELGGAQTSRFGYSARSSVWPETAMSTGDAGYGRQVGRYIEYGGTSVSTHGTGAQSGSYIETSTRVGVAP